MPDIFQLAKSFRANLLKREQKATADTLAAFQTVLDNLKPQIERLQSELELNPLMSAGKVFSLERYRSLERQIKAEITRFAGVAAQITADNQQTNAAFAFRESGQLITAQTSAFVKLPSKAVESFAGFASDGSPLIKIFSEISGGAVDAVKGKIAASVALGHNPKKLASEIRRAFGTPAARALVIARTESLRSYRTANLEVMRENSNLVGGWYWLSARSRRTCAMCFAMDGTHHKLTEDFASHPVCRCSQIPDIGKPLAKTGAEVFRNLDAETQKDILGAGKFALYNDGKIELSDLVEIGSSAKWGVVRREKALKDLGVSATVKQPVTSSKAVSDFSFKTTKEAEAWAEKTYPHITFDFDGAHPDTINPTLKEFDRLAKEYPKVAERLKYVGTYQTKPIPVRQVDGTDLLTNPGGSKRVRFNGEMAHADLDSGGRMGLNPDFYGEPQKFAEDCKRNIAANWTFSAKFEHVMTHEFGHLVDGWIQNIGGDALSAKGLFDITNRRNLAGSRYALKNKFEKFAEGFNAVYNVEESQHTEYVKRLKLFLNKVKDITK